MTTEQKQQSQTQEQSKEELQFIDKERDCAECDKEKEIVLSFGLSTKEEWDKVIKLSKKYGLSRQELDYIYGFYNREFKANKSPGCGKCFYNICKNLEKRYANLIREYNAE